MQAQKTVKGVNLLFLVMVVVMVLFEVVEGILAHFGIDIFFGSITLQLIYSQLVLGLPAIIYVAFVRKDLRFVRFRRIRFSNILICILIYICLAPVLNFLNAVSMLYSSNYISGVMFGVSEEVPFIVGLLLIAVLPGVLEEFIFRGVFYNTYRLGAGFGAALLCGLLFGLVHGNLNQFTYAFVLGTVFALLVEATGSLWSSVVVHALVNAASVVMIYALPVFINWVGSLYETAKAENDVNTMNLISGLMGTEDFSVEALMSAAATELTTQEIVTTIIRYAIPAAFGALFVVLLLRWLARRCGRWNEFCSLFGKTAAAPTAQPNQFNEYGQIGSGFYEQLNADRKPQDGAPFDVVQNEPSADGEPVSAQPVTEVQNEPSADGEPVSAQPVTDGPTKTVPLVPAPVGRVRLITVPLVGGAVIMVLLMILTEVMYRFLPQIQEMLGS